jgi:MFS transporter, DHA3 family, macrolide efflux protein
VLSLFSLLRDVRLRVVLFAETINAFGSGLSIFALAWFLAQSSSRFAGAVLTGQGIGMFIGTVVLGAFLDRWDRRRTLSGANLVLAALVGLLAIALGSEWPAAFVVILTTLIGFGSSILGPALSASIPTLGGGAQIQQLNALVNSTWQTAGLVTPILAGVLTSFWGATNVLFVDAASFVVAAILYVRIRFPDAQTAESTSNSAVTIRSWLSDVRVGVGYFAKRRVLWGSIMGVTSMNAGFAAMFLVFPRVVGRFVVNVDWLDTFGSDAGAIGFGFFETVTLSLEIVASILLATKLVGRTNRGAVRLTFLGSAGPLVGMWILCTTTEFVVAVFASALIGIAVANASTVWPALFARCVPEDLIGRVTGARYSIGSTGRIFATWATGLLLAAESTTTTTTLVFGVLIILTIVGFGVASSAVDGEDQQVLASVGS